MSYIGNAAQGKGNNFKMKYLVLNWEGLNPVFTGVDTLAFHDINLHNF